MKYISTITLLIICFALSACTKDNAYDDMQNNITDVDLTWEENDIPGPSATVKGFECGDMVSRSSWQFNGQKMVFGWETGDAIGLYPTAGTANVPAEGQSWEDVNSESYFINPQTKKHPYHSTNDSICIIDESKAQSTRYIVYNPSTNSQTQSLHNGSGDFEWDNKTRWTAYKPYNQSFNPLINPNIKYTALPFDFSNQTQKGLTDMKALYVGSTGYAKGYNNPEYLRTEAIACKHLAAVDFSFSPEMVWSGTRINFEFRHIGAIARIFLLAPEKELTIQKLELICEKKIFHTKGEVDLTSHMYDATQTNKGVRLIGDQDPQIKSTDDATQKITLEFADDIKTKVPTTDNKYLNYLVAYLMMYPITYDPSSDGDLFAYVTAIDKDNKEVHFVSEPLASKTMVSGKYYQWTSRTHEDDGLYPIELTATLLPWQDIVGAGIETDLTK